MEYLANHYKIPSIFLGHSSIEKIITGKMKIQVDNISNKDTLIFSNDGVHPRIETGHRFYAEDFAKVFPYLNTNTFSLPISNSELSTENLKNAKLIPLENAMYSKNWIDIDSIVKGKPFEKFLSNVKATSDTTDFVALKFNGKGFGIVDILGPSSGAIEINIDNKWFYTVTRFDEYCTYNRMNYYVVTNDLPIGNHLVKIKVSSKRVDKLNILKKRNPSVKIDYQYEKQVFYIGGFLVN
jgi:hypothetical protein